MATEVSAPSLPTRVPSLEDKIPFTRTSTGLLDSNTTVESIGASLALPDSYIGQIATRCGGYCDSLSDTNRQMMAESEHTFFENVTSVAVVFGNYYSPGTGNETATGGDLTVTASVNYPYGSFTQLKFGGQVQGVIPNGGLLVSDFASVTIPCGARAKVRQYLVNTVNMPYSTSIGGPNDRCAFGASGVSDQTMGGIITDSAPGSGIGMVPLAIIGRTTKASVLILLDSIAYQYPDSNLTPSAFGDLALARSFGPEIAYICGALGGASCAGFLSSPSARTNRMALSQYCSHVFNNGGANDLGAGATASDLRDDRTAMAALFSGKPVFGGTITPRTTGSWGSLSGQTVTASESERVTFNGYERAGIPGESGFFDVADGIESDRDSGKIAVGAFLPGLTTGSANSPDGLHFNRQGYERIRNSQVIKPSYFKR